MKRSALCGEDAMSDDTVYTVEDYYDGPREGFATFRGRLHHYRTISAADHEPEQFCLTPVEESLLPAILESWDIWRRWQQAFQRAETSVEIHPALPHERERHEQLKDLLATAVQSGASRAFVAEGDFRPAEGDRASALTEASSLRVTWQVAAAEEDEALSLADFDDEQ